MTLTPTSQPASQPYSAPATSLPQRNNCETASQCNRRQTGLTSHDVTLASVSFLAHIYNQAGRPPPPPSPPTFVRVWVYRVNVRVHGRRTRVCVYARGTRSLCACGQCEWPSARYRPNSTSDGFELTDYVLFYVSRFARGWDKICTTRITIRTSRRKCSIQRWVCSLDEIFLSLILVNLWTEIIRRNRCAWFFFFLAWFS